MATTMTLRALTGELRGQEFTLRSPGCWVLGRSRACRLRLPGDMMVSRHHYLLELEGGSAWVQDLGSLNGTHVNGQKIGQPCNQRPADATWAAPLRQELQDGDELRVCNTVFAVVLSDCPLEQLASGAE